MIIKVQYQCRHLANNMKNYKYILKNILSLTLLVIIFSPFFINAQGPSGGNPTGPSGGNPAGPSGGNPSSNSTKIDIKINNPFKADTIEELIDLLVKQILLPIGGVIAFIMIMYSGFLFVTAQGSLARLTRAKDTLQYTLIGAGLVIGAWTIATAIKATVSQLGQ